MVTRVPIVEISGNSSVQLVPPHGNDPRSLPLQGSANPSQLQRVGTASEIRTHTERVLNPSPLPIGLQRLNNLDPRVGLEPTFP